MFLKKKQKCSGITVIGKPLKKGLFWAKGCAKMNLVLRENSKEEFHFLTNFTKGLKLFQRNGFNVRAH